MKVDTTVDVDFIVPALPAVYDGLGVFVRISTMDTDQPGKSLVIEIHNNGVVNRAEVSLDAYKLGWVQSWKAGNERATDVALLNLLREEEEKDAGSLG